MDILFILTNLALFLAAVIICFYIPGKVLAYYLRLSFTSLETYCFPTALGIVLFLFICYILDSFHLFLLIYPILLIFLCTFFLKKIPLFFPLQKQDKLAFIIIFILAILFSYPMFFSGYYPNGVHLISSNYFDATLHLSLINELQVHFLPHNPGFAGTQFQDYHFFSDYLLSKMIQIFHIEKVIAYFQLFPFFIALLWGTGVYMLINRWMGNKIAALCSVFLTQFGGSFVFLVYVFGYSGPDLNSGFGMLQPSASLVNPPYATSTILIIFGLISLLSYLQTKKNTWIFPIILFFGLAAEFKVYAGIILFSGFLFLLGIKILKKQFHFILIFCGICLVFAMTYLRVIGKGGFLIFFPYWAPITVARDNLKFMNYDNQMMTYAGFHMWHRIVLLQIKIFIMFLFGNIGSRIFGLLSLYFYPNKKKFFLSEFTLTVLSMLAVSFFIPLFFIQSIKVFEITQMFNYFLFFVALFSGIGFGAFLKSRVPLIIKIAACIIILLLTIPSDYEVFYNYLPTVTPSISQQSLEAMRYLEKQGNYESTVLVLPDMQTKGLDSLQWIYATNLFVPAFSNKQGYINNQTLMLPDDIEERNKFVRTILSFEKKSEKNSDSGQSISKKLHEKNIKFIYTQYKLPVSAQIGLKEIYANKEAYIYKVL